MAVTKYLDKTGLTYLWGKIKAWCNATFALISHTHNAATTSANGFLSSTDKTKLNSLSQYPRFTYTAFNFIPSNSGTNYINQNSNESILTHLSTTQESVLRFKTYKGLSLTFEQPNIQSDAQYNDFHFVVDGARLAGDGLIGSAGTLSVPEYEGATASANATSGLVPPALKAERSYFLKGDGTWGDLSSKAEDSNVVHTTGNETVGGTKTFTAVPIIDKTESTIAAGALSHILACKYKNSTGDVNFTTYPISVIGNDAASAYNIGVRLGSINGTTVVTAGESGNTFTSTVGKYDDEILYLTTDNEIRMYVKCANDSTSYAGPVTITGTATSGGTGSTTTVTATNFIGNASTATKATQDGSGNVITSTYLPLSGGTMTGAITRTGQLANTGSDTSSSIHICNGTGANGGGGIWLYGKDHTSGVGKVRLQSYNGTYYRFDVNSNGTSETNTIFTISKNNSTVNKPGILLTGSSQNHIIAAINTDITKGTAPSSNAYWGINFYGKDYDSVNKRIGLVETSLFTSNMSRTSIIAYNCTTNTANTVCAIRAIVDGNGNAYTEAPTPSDTTDNSTKIATTAWIRSATGNFKLYSKGIYNTNYTSDTHDFNDYKENGVYSFSADTTLVNCPSGFNGTLFVFGEGGWVRQLFIRAGTFNTNDHNFYFRVKAIGDTGIWSNWHKIYTDSDTIPVANGGTGSTTLDGAGIVTKSGTQTIAGSKTFSSPVIITEQDASIKSSSNDKRIVIAGGMNAQSISGAKLYLNGVNCTDNNSIPGAFCLQAGNADGYLQLRGNPDGTFTWGGQSFLVRNSYERIEGTSTEHKDLNSYTDPGFYNVKSQYVDNCPSNIGVDSVLLIYPWRGNNTSTTLSSAKYVMQEITEAAASSNNRRWLRKCNNGTWSTWKQIAFTDSSELVQTSGSQTIAGSKTFSATITGSAGFENLNCASCVYGFRVGYNNSPLLSLCVGQGHTNRGLYDYGLNDWLIYSDGSNCYLKGKADTATKLATARTINGVSFDGSANITINDSTKVAKAGDTMTGNLAISTSSPNIYIKSTNLTRNTAPSADIKQVEIAGRDNSDKFTWGIYHTYSTTKANSVGLLVYKGTTTTHNGSDYAGIYIAYDASGNVYTSAPTPAVADGSTKIATTAWVRDATGNFACNAATATKLNTARTINGVDFDGSADITVADSTKLPLAGGTLTGSITIKRANPYIYFVETDWEKGGTVTATQYQGIYFQDKNSVTSGSIHFHYYTNKGCSIQLIAYDTRTSDATGSSSLLLQFSGEGKKIFRPATNNDIQLGHTDYRWSEIWCTQNSINSTSDERLKNSIDWIPENVLDAWENVNWIQFKYNDASQEKGIENARIHTGMIAQQIKTVFEKNSIDINKYGFFLYDKWEAKEAEYDKEGNLTTPAREAGDQYGLRYTEVLCIEAAYQRRKNKILENRISELEKQVSDMIILLQNLTKGNG